MNFFGVISVVHNDFELQNFICISNIYSQLFFLIYNQQNISTEEPKTIVKKPKSYVLALEQYIRLVVMY